MSRVDFGASGRDLVARLRAAAGAPRRPGSEAPLSPAQEGIRLFEEVHPGTPVYNLAYCGAVEGPLDPDVLAGAVRAVVARHDVLRSVFPGSRQVVRDDLVVTPVERDLSGASDDEAVRRARADAAEPFDLVSGPLLRVVRYHLGPARSLLLVVAHHLVADGWSLGVFLAELSAACSGAELPDPVQYADAARTWERPDEADLAHWAEVTRDRAPVDLPADRTRTRERTFESGTVPVALTSEQAGAVRALARERGATPYVVLLAALQAVLGRMTGQEDVSVGSPALVRQRSAAPGAIGPLVSLLVLRTSLAGDPGFDELVDRARRAWLAAQAHRSASAEHRDAGLFEVMLVLQDRPADLVLAGTPVRAVLLEPAAVRRDLELYLWSDPDGGITGFLGYDREVFEEETARLVAERFTVLLTAAVADPTTPVAALPVDPPEALERVRAWSTGEVRPVPGCTLPDLVAEQAARTPDAVAVRAWDGVLTYRQLLDRADRVAAALAARGVGVESAVGVCLERGLDLVVSLLGVLRAGAAYVPVDPAYPAARVRYVLADSGAAVLITTRAVGGGLGARDPLFLDDGLPGASGATRPAVSPDNAAYVIYTSGSTGKPKGVVIEHRQAVAMVAWALETFTAAELARVLASTSICFDLSVFELFAPLGAGGCVVLARGSALDLIEHPTDVTLINTVPSVARELVFAEAIPTTAHTINLAGEPLPPDLVRALHALPQVHRVNNLYGPSEDTTYSTHAPTDPGDHRTPIGRPVHNTRALVLDQDLNPVPRGAVGELYLTGLGITRGYHDRPGLTAQRYLPHTDGTRLYRTGDLARWNHRGLLEYHGRTDHQVKVNGHRVEPGEIEDALRAHPDVTDAVVTTHHRDGTTRLVAHVVTDPPGAGVDGVLRHLRATLPHHLVPHHVHHLAEIPRTPNGKVDRAALPDPLPRRTRTAPRTEREALVAEVWSELLGTEVTDTADDFFALGGHSLLATRASTALGARLGTTVPIRLVFDHPTVADLARHLPEPGGGLAVVPVAPRGDTGGGPVVVPASTGQERLWFLSEMDPVAHLAYHMVGGFRLLGEVDVDAVVAALRALVARHEALRTTLRHDEDGVRQVIAPEPGDVVERLDLTAGGDLAALLDEWAATPLDLAAGPLFRAAAVTLGPADHAVVVSVHHAVADGWSLALLAREFGALVRGEALPPAGRYADHALRQRAHDTGEGLARWRRALSGVEPLDLPTDHPRPERRGHRGAATPLHVPAATAAALERLAVARGTTLFTVLVACYQVLLGRWTGRDDVTVGTAVSGRHLPGTDDVVGFFVNTLPLRGDLGGDPAFTELLGRAHEVGLAALTDQDVPFERLVLDLRDAGGGDQLFPAVLAYQDALPAPDLPGVVATPVRPTRRTSQFELALDLERGADGITGYLVHDTDLFTAGTGAMLAERYRELLEAVARDPERPISALPAPHRASHRSPRRDRVVPESRVNGWGHHGELARHGLPAPSRPPTPEEELVAGVWREVLGVDEVRADDTFFGLGGHSLLAIRVAARLTRLTGGVVPLRALFDHPTVAQLARHLPARRDAEPIPPLDRTPDPDGATRLPASSGQQRLWFLSEYDTDAHLAYHLVGGARVRGPLDVAALRRALDAVVARHEALRTSLRHDGSHVRQVVADAAAPFTAVDLSGRPDPEEALRRLLDAQARTPLDLSAGPLLRVVLAELGHEDRAVVLVVHHAVADGWSLRVLLADLAEHYGAETSGRPATPAPLPVQYADWAEWAARRPARREHLAYWRGHLAGVEPLDLADLPRPARQTYRGASMPLSVPAATVAALERIGADAGASLFMVVLTAFTAALARLSGRTDIAVGTPVSGRDHPDTEHLVGFFADTLVLRTRFDGRDGFREVLAGVRDTTLAAFAHSGAAFADVVEELRPDRDLTRAPLFQVMLVLDDEPTGFAVPGCETSPLDPGRPWSQVELTAHLSRHDGGLRGELVHNADLFTPQRARLVAEHLLAALAEVAADPTAPVAPVVDPAAGPVATAPARRARPALRAPRTEQEELLVGLWTEVLGVPEVGVDDDFFELGGHSLLATRVTTRLTRHLGVPVPLRLLFEHPTIAELAPRLPAAATGRPTSIRRLDRTLRTGPMPG